MSFCVYCYSVKLVVYSTYGWIGFLKPHQIFEARYGHEIKKHGEAITEAVQARGNPCVFLFLHDMVHISGAHRNDEFYPRTFKAGRLHTIYGDIYNSIFAVVYIHFHNSCVFLLYLERGFLQVLRIPFHRNDYLPYHIHHMAERALSAGGS